MTRRYTGGFLSAKEQATDSNTANGIFTLSEAEQLTAAGNFPVGRWTPQRSLKFNSSRSQYISRTPGVQGNMKTYTWSGWVKRGNLANGYLFVAGTSSTNRFQLDFYQDNIEVSRNNGSWVINCVTNAYFRDPSAWYHIVLAVDTTQAVDYNRIKLWVNGVRQTFQSSGLTYPSLNADTTTNDLVRHDLGWSAAAGPYFDGYMADVYFIDGQALDPTYFGKFDAETGTWVPKQFGYPTYSKYQATAGMITNSGFGGFSAANLVDGDLTTGTAFYADSSAAGSYIQWDLGSGVSKEFRKMSLGVYKSSGSGLHLACIVQYSDNGSTWTTASSSLDCYAEGGPYGAGEIFQIGVKWGSVGAHRYWRIYKTDAAAGGDYCNGVDFYELLSDTSTTSYGENGFYLNFADNSSTSYNYAVGADRSGNENNFRTVAHTAGTDVVVDVPGISSTVATDAGGVVRGNYATWNPLVAANYTNTNSMGGTTITFSDGNLATSNPSNSGFAPRMQCWSTIGMTTGKWYAEFTNMSNMNVGVSKGPIITGSGNGIDCYAHYSASGSFNVGNNAVGVATGTAVSASSSDIIGIAFDVDNGIINWYKNGALMGGYTSLNGTASIYGPTSAWFFNRSPDSSGASASISANFGQRPFSYTPPAGFKSLNTTNLPTPIIKRPSEHFDAKTWVGNGTDLIVGNTTKQTSSLQISKSLRFKSGGTNTIHNPYLSRINGTTGTGGAQKWTYSVWVKKGVNEKAALFWGYPVTGAVNDTTNTGFLFETNGTLAVEGQNTNWLVTTQAFTDKTQWHHLVLAADSTQSSPAERLKLYVDGVRVTSFSTNNTSSITQNQTFGIGNASYQHIGTRYPQYDLPFDGELAEANFIDGQQLTPSAFGQYDANNNWVPVKYSGSYGINGFYLPFSVESLTTSSTYAGKFIASSTQYLLTSATSALEFGSGDFTIEFWWYPTSTSRQPLYHGSWASDWSVGIDYNSTGSSNSFGIWVSSNGTSWNLINADGGGNGIGSITPLQYTWNHIAFVRSGTTWQLYVNGKLDLNLTGISGSIVNRASSQKAIGAWWNTTGAGQLSGQLSNFRVLKGQALYTSAFNPPANQLTAITNTQLLTLQNSTFIDNSSNALTITPVNTPTINSVNPWNNGGFGNDSSGNGNHLNSNGHFNLSSKSNVLTYSTPGTYTWTAPTGVTSVSALVIAGGGQGGPHNGGDKGGGGGGAGGLIYNASYSVTPGNSYTVTVGAGGSTTAAGSNAPGQNGGNSVFATLTAIGGGGGAQGYGGGPYAGGNGGSGGGGTADGTGGNGTPGTGTAGQGFAGGINVGINGSAGGGGAGGVGGNSLGSNYSSPQGGHGGPGLAVDITGISTYYAGGGGGGMYTGVGGRGGIGGGGAAGLGAATRGNNGSDGFGGGGGGAGGGGASNASGGNGGNGVVILSYTNASTYTGFGANQSWSADNINDTLTDFDDGNGNIRGNYAVLNANDKGSSITVTAGGLGWTQSATTAQSVRATLPMVTGKWYWETTGTSNMSPGIAKLSASTGTYVGGDANGWSYFVDGTLYNSGSSSSFGATYGTTDIIGIAFDANTGKLWFSKNGTWQASGNPATGANPAATVSQGVGQDVWYPAMSTSVSGAVTGVVNFGQTPFAYTPPTGFKSLNTKNLKDIGSYNLPDTFGNVVNTPDLVWTKIRSASGNSNVTDTVRGPGQLLQTNTINAATTNFNTTTSFLPNGVEFGSDFGNNNSGSSYVGWMWNRGQTPGFDMVQFAASSNVVKFPHNLGVAPSFMIVKGITASTGWAVYHSGVGSGYASQLQATTPPSATTDWWGNQAPTSTHFQVGANFPTSYSFIAYLWAEVPGFSKFGTYVANGSSDGPVVYCGFKPRWIMMKRYDAGSAENWLVIDTARDTGNFGSGQTYLLPSSSAAEGTGTPIADITSTGFKLRSTATNAGANCNYMYAAFAEAPFKYANAR